MAVRATRLIDLKVRNLEITGITTGGALQATTAVTATADGTGTGYVPVTGGFVKVTSANAAHLVTLPLAVVGLEIKLAAGATGFELQTSTPSIVGINGGIGVGFKSTIPANSLAVLVCDSTISWKGYTIAADGTLAKIEVASGTLLTRQQEKAAEQKQERAEERAEDRREERAEERAEDRAAGRAAGHPPKKNGK
jgi:hypothetical protein